MTSLEPINLLEWKRRDGAPTKGRLFTCGRPGRATFERKRVLVPEHIIDLWVEGLPKATTLHIVSLLGKKKNGFSEFAYYPFRSALELGPKPTWEDWLNTRYSRRFVVREIPTVDAQGIPQDDLGRAVSQVLSLLAAEYTVVVIDSAGAERTSRVCEAAGYRPMVSSR